MKMIEVKNLTFSYDDTKTTIDDISFSVEEGSYTTIVGHNGSGKSTVAKLLAGLLEKKSGEIYLGGLELTAANLTKIRSLIGIVFQNPDNQFIGSTVRDDIAFGLENHCVHLDVVNNKNALHDAHQRVEEWPRAARSGGNRSAGGQKPLPCPAMRRSGRAAP